MRWAAVPLAFTLLAGTAHAGPELDLAVSTGRWLLALERRDPAGGSSWPASDRNAFGFVGIDSGSAGVARFFLRLHEVTGDVTWRDAAVRAGEHLAANHAAGRVNGPDWLAGAAGGGETFLALWRATGDERWLQHATAAARWLVNTAVAADNGYHWLHGPGFPKVYTGHAHGASGIGGFLLDVYAVTGDPVLLATAEGAYRWMTRHEVPLAQGASGWKRLAADDAGYNLWCGGATGILPFLWRLHTITGQPEYLDAYRRTAEGLLKTARPQAVGLAWAYETTLASRSLPIVFCHGTSSTALALLQAGANLGDDRYRQAGRAGLQWVASRARPQGDGSMWEHIAGSGQLETGYFTGTASVGRAFVAALGLDADPAWLAQALAASRGLAAVAHRPAPDQVRWPNSLTPGSEGVEYPTGVYSGAAGIGLFLLELHEVNP